MENSPRSSDGSGNSRNSAEIGLGMSRPFVHIATLPPPPPPSLGRGVVTENDVKFPLASESAWCPRGLFPAWSCWARMADPRLSGAARALLSGAALALLSGARHPWHANGRTVKHERQFAEMCVRDDLMQVRKSRGDSRIICAIPQEWILEYSIP
jgi:hypothetical protein